MLIGAWLELLEVALVDLDNVPKPDLFTLQELSQHDSAELLCVDQVDQRRAGTAGDVRDELLGGSRVEPAQAV